VDDIGDVVELEVGDIVGDEDGVDVGVLDDGGEVDVDDDEVGELLLCELALSTILIALLRIRAYVVGDEDDADVGVLDDGDELDDDEGELLLCELVDVDVGVLDGDEVELGVDVDDDELDDDEGELLLCELALSLALSIVLIALLRIRV